MAKEIDYSALIDQHLREVVRDVLRQVAKNGGFADEHHAYISFRTDYPGVDISADLRGQYQNEMTIVMQHQFWDLQIEDARFHVTLSFRGIRERLSVPFAALTSFTDPAAKFGLQFTTEVPKVEADPEPQPAAEEEDDGHSKVITLDSFRKRSIRD